MFQLILVAASILLATVGASAVVNKEVSRVIDASTSIVRVTTSIKAVNVDGEYKLILPNALASHLAHMSVTSKGNELTVKAPVMNGDYTIFAVEVKESSPSIKVSSVFTSILEPYPAEITQREPQFIRLKDSHYFLSPYATETQKTTVKLASPTVESFTKLAPFTNRGNSLQFGPYENIAPYSTSEASVHYLNNFPFAKFSTMTRELEVSHWGNIAVEEIYELQHAGAKLAGGFSRIDYQMMRGGPGASPSFRSVVATLPAQASGIYYRDQIGNISTSTVRHLPDGELELELESRFPIFGGWKTQFYLGYSVPTENWITTDGADRYNLKLDFFTAFDNVWVEDMELKVVLPEGCENIKVNVPYAVEQSSARRFTYLDSELNGGRPVIILRAKNLVSEHDKQVTISYTFAKKRIYVEPLMLVATFFVFFVLCSLLSRTGSAATSTKAKKAATSAAQEETN